VTQTMRLPMEAAVGLSAFENLERDVRMGLIDYILTEEDLRIYKDEARELMETMGENYDPEFPDHHRVILSDRSE